MFEHLADLPDNVRATARVDGNGEVSWHHHTVRAAIDAIAGAGFVILGLDLRTFDEYSRVSEIAWCDTGTAPTVDTARVAALAALERLDADPEYDWILVSWCHPEEVLDR